MSRGKCGYIFIDVLIAILIVQICLAGAIGALVSHSNYLLRLIKANAEIIRSQNEQARGFRFVYTPGE
ncbi:MAG: hypothetical protein JW874_09070 [Spirochaetales bacterium]|nr:hypothetical protein [Spirochaetales bacterium]